MTMQETVVREPEVQVARRPAHAPEVQAVQPPPLESGDRLTRREFERRYHAMPRVKKAELIEGGVYIASPARSSHSQAHAQIMGWLGTYAAFSPGVEAANSASVRLDLDNEVQPDALLRLTVGGQSRVSEDDYLEGAPELIAEVATSSATYDLHDKLRVYRRNEVQEYVVWQIYDERLDWFAWREGEYMPLVPDEAGVVRSQVFPGLWLAVPALLAGDLAGVLKELQNGLASAEHAAFVERLSNALGAFHAAS